jgi:hypothetical protein
VVLCMNVPSGEWIHDNFPVSASDKVCRQVSSVKLLLDPPLSLLLPGKNVDIIYVFLTFWISLTCILEEAMCLDSDIIVFSMI